MFDSICKKLKKQETKKKLNSCKITKFIAFNLSIKIPLFKKVEHLKTHKHLFTQS